ncbi:MAG: hypothetical protein QM499_11895, partial [Flavobacteriaceae bacterium]
YTFESIPRLVSGEDDGISTVITSEDNFSALMSFGIGADYKLGNGYLTFLYGDIVSVVEGNNGEFPIDFTIGYKFNL